MVGVWRMGSRGERMGATCNIQLFEAVRRQQNAAWPRWVMSGWSRHGHSRPTMSKVDIVQERRALSHNKPAGSAHSSLQPPISAGRSVQDSGKAPPSAPFPHLPHANANADKGRGDGTGPGCGWVAALLESKTTACRHNNDKATSS
ncbi:hypothetical protein IAQ61_001693 [Plenodomus lingam]|uniref:uncharacterized protein n=1 Tax=Leptosphaeria maculans TaxID=5022 RepID=UPI003330868A|nr:hypothetical protein IAQ61_001693 [Plenodomus lingam]